MTPELQNTLAALAQKLGTSVEYLWPLLVRHTYINSLMLLIAKSGIAFAGFVAVVIALRVRFFSAIAKKPYIERSDDEDDLMTVWAMTLVAGGAFFILFSLFALMDVGDVMVPEAAAIRSIMGR